MNVLEIWQLRKHLPRLKLDIATMEVAEGEFAVLLGLPKSGKATLFKLALDMLFPDFGTIRVCGLDAHREGEAVKQQVGLVARRPGLLNSASLRRLKNMVRPFYREWQEQIFRHYMNQFELNENLLYGHLGPAAKKQFTLSLALAHKPKLLLLEEPFLQLPAEEKEPVARALRQERQERGLSLLLATASPEEAATWADTLHIMHNGSLRLSLSAEQVPEYSAGLNWQGLRKHSQNGPTAQKIAQTQALFAYYTKTGEKNA